MSPNEGDPILPVRLKPRTMARLKEEYGGQGGRAGGVSFLVRRLVYRELDQDMPAQRGRDEKATMADLFTLRREVRAYGSEGYPQGKELLKLLGSLIDQANAEEDPVRLSFLREISGELSLALLENGALTVEGVE